MAAVYPGSSTVPAAVVIVVKHKAYLLVGQLIIGVQAQSFGQQIIGVQARSFVSLISHGRLGHT